MADIILFVRVYCALFIISALLYVKPIPKILSSLTPKASFKLKKWDISKITKLVDLFFNLRIPFLRRGSCLKRSLILYKFLRENGVEVKINIGVKKKEQLQICGHAWLTLNDKPYLTKPPQIAGLQEFKVCFVFPQ